MYILKVVGSVLIIVILLSFVHANENENGILKVKKVSLTGEFNNSKDLLIDENFVEKGYGWDDENCLWWTEKNNYIIFDLGEEYNISDIIVEVDNNDAYKIDYSINGKDYKNLFQIKIDYGEVDTGMDIFSSEENNENYIKEIDFKPINARYLKLYATDGDDMFSAAEIQIKGIKKDTK